LNLASFLLNEDAACVDVVVMLKLIVTIGYYYTPNWRWANHQYSFQNPAPVEVIINALKHQQTKAKTALSDERDRQQQAKATERVQKAQQALIKARLP
jgi:hypothetical protein